MRKVLLSWIVVYSKCPSRNKRTAVRNLILAKSQTSSLINQRCWLSFDAKCVSLSHAVCGCWSMLSSVLINTRTHTLSLSLFLRYLALFPPLSILLKSSLCDCLIINWNTDFTVLGCSHFIGSTNMKSYKWKQPYFRKQSISENV